jgi:pimeloyl-ACP methyl ester carboxylesterase
MNFRLPYLPVSILLSICIYLCNSVLSAQIPDKPFDNSRIFMIDSIRIHCRIWNEQLVHPRGKVLLVHGFVGSTFSWRENIDTLVKSGYYVVAVDLPGFGYSDRNPSVNQSQSNKARILLSLLSVLDQSDTSKWNIAGHSMGGGAVEAMTLMGPERVKTLTIVDGMVFQTNGNMQGAFITLSRNKQYNRAFSSIVKKNVFTYSMIERLFKKNFGFIPDSSVVEGYLKPLLIDGTAECVISVWSNSKEILELNVDRLEKIPVLVIWGKKDGTIHLKRGKRFVKNVPLAELKIIPDARHDPMETHPGIFNAYLIEFMNRNN